jgi:rhomboid family GlyGly-CTERM serine protease
MKPALRASGPENAPASPTLAAEEAAWPLLALGFALGAVCISAASPERWDWQPSLAWEQPWRWWTSAGVHWSGLHLGMNLAACALVGWLGWRARLGTSAAVAWSLAWPLSSLGLLAEPQLLHFGGLSGVLHAGVAIVAWRLCRRCSAERKLGWLMLAGLGFKIALEQPWRAALVSVDGADFLLAPLSHLSGAVTGLVAACIEDGLRCVSTPDPHRPAPLNRRLP